MQTPTPPTGPLCGVRVLEFAGMGPAPFCAMLLSDLGAEVLRVDRRGAVPRLAVDVTSRGRLSIELDLKSPADRSVCLDAIRKADVLIEGYRPGVMERLGLGPEAVAGENPRLIYGRMTGWGQDGPLAQAAGHDINYIALTGALAAMGDPDRPPSPPLNLVGDFGGGALYLALGLVAALLERERSGKGQVVDAAMIDGVASLMAVFNGLSATQPDYLRRGQVTLAGAAPNYHCYECADGRHIAIGALEPQFYNNLLAAVGRPYSASERRDPAEWPDQIATLASIFKTRTRDAWCALLEGTDACVAPVLDLQEARAHPHMVARGVYAEIAGLAQPAPAPRFSRTPGAIQGPAPAAGEGGRARLQSWMETL